MSVIRSKQQALYIVESGNEIMELIASQAETSGISCVHLDQEDEARYALLHHRGDQAVCIIDVTDEKMHAYDMLRALHEADSELIPIVVSRSNEPVDIDRALSYGAEDYIIKDQFSAEELLTKIRRAFLRNSVDEHTLMNEFASQSQGSMDVTAIKVLIVEDDQFLRDLAERKLKQEGFHVDVALDGTEGLKKIEKTKPTVVLLDIILPGIDGFDILKKVRAHPDAAVQKTVVILLSNLGQEADVAKGERLGADDYLIKANFTIDEIIEKIKTAVAAKQSGKVS